MDILVALAAMPASTFSTLVSTLLGIGLSGYRIAGGKSHLLRDHGIQGVDLVHVPVKQLQEGSLGSRGPLEPSSFMVEIT